MVLDADALMPQAFDVAPPAGRIRVLTPHPGEMSRLTGKSTAEIQKDRIGAARGYATEHGVTAGAQRPAHRDRFPRRPRLDQSHRHSRAWAPAAPATS